MFSEPFFALLAIPVCSELNHLGGQSTDIPNPRIICRVFAMPICLAAIGLISGIPLDVSLQLLVAYIAGFALWAVFKWGPMFMAVNNVPLDCRDYKTKWYQTNTYITPLCDHLMGVSPLTKLTLAQCKEWGMLYGTIRGGFMYPLFIFLGLFLTGWAPIIGSFCFFQGLIYRGSSQVLRAEYKFGALIGIAFAIIIMAAVS